MLNNKKVLIAVGIIIAILICGVAVYMNFIKNQPAINNDIQLPDDVITNQPEDENRELIPDSDPVTIEYPEIDWEEPPVVTIYNPDADLNDDGHVDKGEWEQWVAENPADLNQDLYSEDWELKAIEEGKTTEQQQVQNDYDEILKGLEVDAESSIIVNPTIDEDTGSMSGENSNGEFIQTPPLEIPESDEEMLRELLDNAGVPEEVTEQIVQESFPTEQVKPVEQTKPAESKPEIPVQPSKPVENKPADQNNNQKPWEGKSPFADSAAPDVIEIKPGEGSGDTTDTTKFN